MAGNEIIVVQGYYIIGEPVILFVNINYLHLQIVLTFTTSGCTMMQINRCLPWLLDFYLTSYNWFFYGYEYRQILPSHNSEATARTIDSDSRLHTGDIEHYDEERPDYAMSAKFR